MITNKLPFIAFFLLISITVFSQSFNVDQVRKGKLINVTGGASANAVAYSGNNAREPFTYFLNGNININVLGLYNLPFSFSYSSQKFGYNKPVLSNRLSIHPSYKWVTTHIGDASMTFSPYTLSGHQFTGFGVDLSPQGKFKISAMYGLLVKNSDFDPVNPSLVPTYKRFGYGFKTAYTLEKVNLGLTFFKAKDEVNSLSVPIPFELGISPKENAAVSLDATFSLFKKLQVATEYANSSITEDSRATNSTKAAGIASYLLSPNSTTANFNAYKVNLVYPAGKGTVGLGYERVDPNYRTLGGYFFNNDLENITLNASQSLYKDKISVNTNFGLQSDNLKQQKESQMKRLVSSATVDIKATKKLNLNLTYSNFQSFTNSRNQFDYINQTNKFQNLDTLNYRQVNQNAGLTINYLLKDSKLSKQSLNANFDMQDALNEQQGKTVAGGATTSYNSAMSYTLGFPEKSMNILASVNSSINKSDSGTSIILGPTAGVTKLFFDKKLNTSLSTSYNTSYNNDIKGNDVINLRLNGSYLYLEKHNINLGITSLFSQSGVTKVRDITANLTYAYSFDKIKVRFKKVTKPEENLVEDNILEINSGDTKLKGKREDIIKQLQSKQLEMQTLPAEKLEKLEKILKLAELSKNDKDFKIKALNYLKFYQKNVEVINKNDQKVTKPEENLLDVNILEIKSGDTELKGKKEDIIKQLQLKQLALQMLPAEKLEKLEQILKLAELTPDDKDFKIKALDYLEFYQKNVEIINKYNKLLVTTAKKLENGMQRNTESIENIYLLALGRVKNHKLHNTNPAEIKDKVGYKSYIKLVERASKAEKQFVNHKWMLEQFAEIAKTPINELYKNQKAADFGKQVFDSIFKAFESKKPDAKISLELKRELTAFFNALAVKDQVKE